VLNGIRIPASKAISFPLALLKLSPRKYFLNGGMIAITDVPSKIITDATTAMSNPDVIVYIDIPISFGVNPNPNPTIIAIMAIPRFKIM
jgi:hypothetical protein